MPPAQYQSREAQNHAKRFMKHGESSGVQDAVLNNTSPEIEPTNNIAERAIRFVAIDRRVTQGVRGEWGRRRIAGRIAPFIAGRIAPFMERLWTVLATGEKQTRDVLNYLQSCLRAC